MLFVDRGGGRWKAVDPDTGAEHFVTCSAEDARARRIRYGLEAGFYPVSPSSIKDYLDCPWYYLLNHWSMLQRLGMISDEILARFPDGPPPLPGNPFGDLGNYAHRYFAARLRNEEPPLFDGPPDLFRDWRYMRDTFERQMDLGLWWAKGASVEEEMIDEWQDETGMTVQIKVIIDYWRMDFSDRYRRWAHVTDQKTGRDVTHDGDLLKYIEKPAEFRVEAAWRLRNSIQAATNMWVLMTNIGDLDGGTFQENHLRFNGELIRADFTRQDLMVFFEALASTVNQMIRDREYRPNRFCKVCPAGYHPVSGFLEIELDERGRKLVARPPETAEEALRMAWNLHDMQDATSAVRSAMSDWTEINGPVGPYGHWPHEREIVAPTFTLQPEEGSGDEPREVVGALELLGLLQRMGLDGEIARAFNVDGTWLRSVLTAKTHKDKTRLAEALRRRPGLLVKVTETKFGENPNWQLEEARRDLEVRQAAEELAS